MLIQLFMLFHVMMYFQILREVGYFSLHAVFRKQILAEEFHTQYLFAQ